MLDFTIDENDSILILKPKGKLSEDDFKRVAKEVDPYIEKVGHLHGIIIYVEYFPGWEDFSAMTEHFKFVNEHHKKINCIALVTNSILGDIAENILNHFINAELKHFSYSDLNESKEWIINYNK